MSFLTSIRRLPVGARLFLLAFLLFLFVPVFLYVRCGWKGCPNVDRLKSYQPGKASKLIDRNGKLLALLRPVEGETTPLARIPEHVRAAFLSVEDKRFYEHDGVDWRRVAGATIANLKRASFQQGFSTITMQLARNVFPDRLPAKERTLIRKLLEIRVAGEIEDEFSKDEILELYLSHVYFGNGARGISAASRHYFGKRVEELTLSQGALLAAMLKGPSHYDPRRHPEAAEKRRNLVLDLIEAQGQATKTALTSARKAPLGVIRRRGFAESSGPVVAPYFIEEVRRQLEEEIGEQLYEETLVVQTTLDLPMQEVAEQELRRHLTEIESGALGSYDGTRFNNSTPVNEASQSDYLQGAVIALRSHTGDVLVWVGGRDYTHSRFDHVKNARRQTGSAFKPFVYAAALSRDHVLSESLRDEPLRIKLESGQYWEPKNFDNETEGSVTVRDALVRSKNIPTVLLAQDTGLDRIKDLAQESGIESEIETTPALPLGTPAVSPMELAAAYTPFATLGDASVPRLILHVKDSNGTEIWSSGKPETHEVLDEGVAFLVTNVLQEAIDSGTGSIVRKLGFDLPAAGKTGTTNDATDAWFVGYTPEVVMGVWVGFDQPRTIMSAATGSRLAAPLWTRIMKGSSIVTSTARKWIVPESVLEEWVDPSTGKILEEGCSPSSGQAYREFFLDENMPDSDCPQSGEIIAFKKERRPSDEEEARGFDLFPGDLFGRSRPAPARQFEEAESPKKYRFRKEIRKKKAGREKVRKKKGNKRDRGRKKKK